MAQTGPGQGIATGAHQPCAAERRQGCHACEVRRKRGATTPHRSAVLRGVCDMNSVLDLEPAGLSQFTSDGAVAVGLEGRTGRGRDRYPYGPRRCSCGGSVAPNGPGAAPLPRHRAQSVGAVGAQDGPARLSFCTNDVTPDTAMVANGFCRRCAQFFILFRTIESVTLPNIGEDVVTLKRFQMGRCEAARSSNQRGAADDPRGIDGPEIPAVKAIRAMARQEQFVRGQNAATGPLRHGPAGPVADMGPHFEMGINKNVGAEAANQVAARGGDLFDQHGGF